MKKALLFLLTFVLAISPTLGLMSCGGGAEGRYEINFMVDGQIYDKINISTPDEPIVPPPSPTKDGYTFVGWYWDDESWQMPLTSDPLSYTMLKQTSYIYAKWLAGSCDHIDDDDNFFCDKCNNPYTDGIEDPCATKCQKKDDDPKDGKCDFCNKKITHTHKDIEPKDNKCDTCGKEMEMEEFPTVEWIDDDPIELIFMMSKASEGQRSPSGCERYLAGEDLTAKENIDDEVAIRNADAYYITNVLVEYDYYDDVPEYGWGKNIDIIINSVKAGGTNAPDIYTTFTYDMVGVSLKGSFANLKRTAPDIVNYFSFLDPDYDESVNNRGYMYEQMESMTLSHSKMYLLASDYFIDLIRSFYVIPVNVELLESVGIAITGDVDGDGKFTINDLYLDVQNKGWTYERVIEYSEAIYFNSGTANDGEDIDDRLGFVTYGGIVSSGLIYSADITVIDRTWQEQKGDYDYNYPHDAPELFDLFDAVEHLMNAPGIVYLNSSNSPNYKEHGNTMANAARNRFCDNQILFGSIIMLGSLECEEYQELKETSGLGVLPVPLYISTPDADDNYLTAIHYTARPGAIATNTEKFSACTAFLDYQSTHSSYVIDEYYDCLLGNNAGDPENKSFEMLQYIRKNVRSALEKTFEESLPLSSGTPFMRWSHIMETNEFCYGADISTDFAARRGEKAAVLHDIYYKYANIR